MKKTCLLGALLLCSTAAVSQELFPELSVLDKPAARPVNQQTEPAAQQRALDVAVEEPKQYLEENLESADVASPDVQQVELAANPETPPNSKEEEEDMEDRQNDRKLRMFLDDVDSTLTPVRTMSFCFATIKLYNQLKKPLSSFQATLTYGDIPIKFNASNVQPNGTASQELTLAGTACEYMLDTPKIDITKCVVPDMQEKRCKDRFLFEPYESSI